MIGVTVKRKSAIVKKIVMPKLFEAKDNAIKKLTNQSQKCHVTKKVRAFLPERKVVNELYIIQV